MEWRRPGVEGEVALAAVAWSLEVRRKAHQRPLVRCSSIEASVSSSSARCRKASGSTGAGESNGMRCAMLTFKMEETGRWCQAHMATLWLNSAIVAAR
jgi:hypothetical protein